MGPPGSSEASTCCLTRRATCSSVRCAGCLVAPPSSFTGSQPATDDHRRVDQVLVVLVAEEALAQLGQPVLSALQGARELLLPVAQQDVVVGPLADEGLVVVEVLAGRPQAQVGVVVLARPGQLPVRAREQRVGPRSAPQVQHDGSIRPRASPGAAVRGLRDLLSLSRPTCHSFFTGPVFFPRSFRGAFMRARGARGGSEPGAVYRPSALRENGDSRARDPGQHAGDTVLRQHRLQAGSAHL